MKINYNYLPNEFEDTSEIFQEWKNLIASTEYTLGTYVEEWETQFSKYVKSKYCIATNNGTDALILSLKALGLKSGDEVITVANTFYATVGAIVACGATPVLVDSDDSYQIDINKLENAITSKTKAILPVHWGGNYPDIENIMTIAQKYNLYVVEDACMGIGGIINSKHPGTFGDIGAFSMHPLKSLNVIGDGGMVVTDSYEFYEWMSRYRNHGMINRDEIEFWGVNMRIQPLQAVVAQIGLKKLNKVIKQRNSNAKFLDKKLNKLKGYVKIPQRKKVNLETFSLYMATFEQRNELKEFYKK